MGKVKGLGREWGRGCVRGCGKGWGEEISIIKGGAVSLERSD